MISRNKKIIINIIKKRKKNISIIINKDGVVTVYAPIHINDKRIKLFINKNKTWIENKYNEISRKKESITKKYMSGEKFLFNGINVILKIVEYKNKLSKVILKEDELIIFVKDKNIKKEEIKKALKKFYKNKSKKIILEEVEKIANNIGFKYNSVKIRDLKRKWGSCSINKEITFNWKLIMAPYEQRKYVIIHELCHTIEMNHSKAFWNLVEIHCSEYGEHRKWFKQHGYMLDFD